MGSSSSFCSGSSMYKQGGRHISRDCLGFQLRRSGGQFQSFIVCDAYLTYGRIRNGRQSHCRSGKPICEPSKQANAPNLHFHKLGLHPIIGRPIDSKINTSALRVINTPIRLPTHRIMTVSPNTASVPIAPAVRPALRSATYIKVPISP